METKGKVLYLNQWLDCPDDIHRRNYQYQIRLSEAKAKFFYDMREKGASEWQIAMDYQKFIRKNRANIKFAPEEEDFTSPPHNLI